MQELITKINAYLKHGYLELIESDYLYEITITSKEEYMGIPEHLFSRVKEIEVICYLEGLLRGLELSVMDKGEQE